MTTTGIQDLPHEILDKIVALLPTARAVSYLGQTNRAFHQYVDNEGWAVFTRARFPWLDTAQTQPWNVLARSLTSTSRAWDRRAFVVHEARPRGSIVQFPGGIELDGWKKPTGQTIGYCPHIDAYEHADNAHDHVEVLAFTTGASICLRRKIEKIKAGRKTSEDVRWSVYQPTDCRPGRDDFTSVHLIQPHATGSAKHHELIAGAVNGNLHYISVPMASQPAIDSAVKCRFTTTERVQATSLLQDRDNKPLLAAALGNTKIALYNVDAEQPHIDPSTTHDFRTPENTHPAFVAQTSRIWTVTQLSQQHLAVGVGQSAAPIQLCSVTPSGIDPSSIRGFSFENEAGKALKLASVFKIVPLLNDTRVFLSGSYDGLVRLHDLRSSRDVEMYYSPPHADLAISSLLVRGQQTLLAGTVRHEMMCVFDLRSRGGQYYYAEATDPAAMRPVEAHCSVFMSPRHGNSRSDGSVYSLASSSSSSPTVYLGIQNSVLVLSATELGHQHPDPLHFSQWLPQTKRRPKGRSEQWYAWKDIQIRDVALYEHEKLYKQKPVPQTPVPVPGDMLDSRWTIK